MPPTLGRWTIEHNIRTIDLYRPEGPRNRSWRGGPTMSGNRFANSRWKHSDLSGNTSVGFGRELSELGFGAFVNRKLVNVAPAGSPLSGPIAS